MQDIAYILSNPDDYWPVLIFAGLFLVLWTALCAAGLAAWWGSRRWGGRHPRFFLVLALLPTLISLAGLFAVNCSFHYEGEIYRGTVDLKWLLIVPALLGAMAFRTWFQFSRPVNPVPS
jgi:hypothetical protein